MLYNDATVMYIVLYAIQQSNYMGRIFSWIPPTDRRYCEKLKIN